VGTFETDDPGDENVPTSRTGEPHSSEERALDISAVQRQAWDNKLAKGFNITDVALEFGLLTAEVGESFTAWRKRLPDFGEELADVLIYLAGLAEMTGIDLDAAVERKLAKNAMRSYETGHDGVLRRVQDSG
jgi:NTP pyrophosphatase (non-canonical NTP hydrolase)